MAESYARRIKRLTYRVDESTDLVALSAHWRGFSFDAGSVVCCWGGDWGEVQVWASTVEEGIRVISHAAASPGSVVPAPPHPSGVLNVYQAKQGRNGKAGRFEVATVADCPFVTSRRGSSGPPLVVSAPGAAAE